MTAAGWTHSYDTFVPGEEKLREALCTLGNGYFATRGAAEESSADDVHYPGTYLAGGFNRLGTEVSGRVIENEDLVNVPNWLPLTFRPAGGDWLDLQKGEVAGFHQELDLRRGVLLRRFTFRDGAGRDTAVESRRLVSMADPHVAALQVTLTPVNWSGEVEVTSALDGRIVNWGVARYRKLNSRHLAPLEARAVGDDGMLLVVETNQARLRIAEAARTRLLVAGEPAAAHLSTGADEGYVARHATVTLSEGQPLTIEKTVALYTGRDFAISEPALAAVDKVAEIGGFETLLDDHAAAWRRLWDRCDVALKEPGRTQMIVRLHIFHLLQTVSPHSCELDVGVPARGLHGEAYRGHIFWDEIFILPFLNYHVPEISRSLLLYRYRRLPAARALAAEAGLKGALYPWQSGSSGREESQVLHLNPKSGRWMPDNSALQRHANAAIALNVWRYYETTGDREFLTQYGAEMLVENARLWASLTAWSDDKQRYVINGVMGPDEFHDAYPDREEPGLDNNAYSNVMASWVMATAHRALDIIPQWRRRELVEVLRLDEAEMAVWDEIAAKLYVPFHDDGVISQFEGYDELEEFDWEGYSAKYGDIHRLDRILESEDDTANRYKASKQPDVLMLFYVFSMPELQALFDRLGYAFDADTVARCIAYYRPRTSDGSTLSRLVHAWVLADVDREESWTLFQEALLSDVNDVQGGTTAEGIHAGVMAGTADLVQRGYTASRVVDGVLHVNACDADELQGMTLNFVYRGSSFTAMVARDRVVLQATADWDGEKIGACGRVHNFKAGDRLEVGC